VAASAADGGTAVGAGAEVGTGATVTAGAVVGAGAAVAAGAVVAVGAAVAATGTCVAVTGGRGAVDVETSLPPQTISWDLVGKMPAMAIMLLSDTNSLSFVKPIRRSFV
jgi:carbonic anhydrase/acetyltransferase-like protein (isoleucine patch superfamily)